MALKLEPRLERMVRLDAGRLDEAALSRARLERRVFTSVYHDTPDRRLARAGLELCRRTENGKSLWRLTLPRGEARLVLEELGGPAGPPDALRELLTAPLHGTEVEPVLELRTRRAGSWVEQIDGATAEVALDEVDVLDHGRMAESFREVGVTLLEGEPRSLRSVERRLRREGARDATHSADDPAAEPVDRSAVGLLRRMLQRQFEQVIAHDPGVRIGDEPEDVHDLRVAVRRSRAVLRTARPLLDRAWSDPLRDELRWLGTSLGPVRDLDVLLAHIEDEAPGLGPEAELGLIEVRAALETEREQAREAALAALTSPRYLTVLEELGAAARGPRVRRGDVDPVALASTEFRKLRKAIRTAGDDPGDEELHRIRIQGKRARYATELAAPLLGKRAGVFVAIAKRFQDVVGEHQDGVVAEAHLRTLLPRTETTAAAFALGRLTERQRVRRTSSRAALPAAWAELDSCGRKLF